MPGDMTVIQHLNKILGNELIAINQYFLQSKILEHHGFTKLAERSRKESIEEMRHAECLTKRILMINGLPNYQDLGKLRIGEWPKEMLEADLALEIESVKDLQAAIAYCDQVQDYTSSQLAQDILASEEEHIEWLTAQLTLIKQMGEQNYLQLQAS